MEENSQKEILDNYHGNWINTEGNEVTKLSISEEEVILLQEKDGKVILKETFSGSCHWFDRFLCFTGAGRMYNITHADKEHLIFGEQATATLGNYKWVKKFKRVK